MMETALKAEGKRTAQSPRADKDPGESKRPKLEEDFDHVPSDNVSSSTATSESSLPDDFEDLTFASPEMTSATHSKPITQQVQRSSRSTGLDGSNAQNRDKCTEQETQLASLVFSFHKRASSSDFMAFLTQGRAFIISVEIPKRTVFRLERNPRNQVSSSILAHIARYGYHQIEGLVFLNSPPEYAHVLAIYDDKESADAMRSSMSSVSFTVLGFMVGLQVAVPTSSNTSLDRRDPPRKVLKEYRGDITRERVALLDSMGGLREYAFNRYNLTVEARKRTLERRKTFHSKHGFVTAAQDAGLTSTGAAMPRAPSSTAAQDAGPSSAGEAMPRTSSSTASFLTASTAFPMSHGIRQFGGLSTPPWRFKQPQLPATTYGLPSTANFSFSAPISHQPYLPTAIDKGFTSTASYLLPSGINQHQSSAVMSRPSASTLISPPTTSFNKPRPPPQGTTPHGSSMPSVPASVAYQPGSDVMPINYPSAYSHPSYSTFAQSQP
ncbi:MAG: hypothetical protein Q9157_007443, partial [Trypethelium eluteriae]